MAPARGTGRPGRLTRDVHVVQGIDACARSTARCSSSSASSTASTSGIAYLLDHLVAEALARDARPTVITFDHHPDEVLMGTRAAAPARPRRAARAAGGRGRRGHRRPAFDEALRADAVRRVRRADPRAGGLAGFLMTPDAAFGFERRGTPRRWPSSVARRLRGRRRPAVHARRQTVRSSAIRVAIVRRRPAPRPRAARPPGGGRGGGDRRRARRACQRSRRGVPASRWPLRAALTRSRVAAARPDPGDAPQGPTGRRVERAWSAEGRLSVPVRRTAQVTAGGVTILGLGAAPEGSRLRVAFSADGAARPRRRRRSHVSADDPLSRGRLRRRSPHAIDTAG